MLARCALVNTNDATRKEVQRLCEALDDDGLKPIADKVRESLHGPNDEQMLQQLINATAQDSPRRKRLEAALDAYQAYESPPLLHPASEDRSLDAPLTLYRRRSARCSSL